MGASIIEIQNGTTVTPIPHYTAAEVQNRTALSAAFTFILVKHHLRLKILTFGVMTPGTF